MLVFGKINFTLAVSMATAYFVPVYHIISHKNDNRVVLCPPCNYKSCFTSSELRASKGSALLGNHKEAYAD